MGGQFDPEDNFIINVLRKRYDVIISENPDYLVYSVHSTDYMNYNCVRIFYTAENIVPDFNICDYGIGFHYLEFGDRYIRFPLYLVDGYRAYAGDDYASDLQRALHKHERAADSLRAKTDFCAFVYSNAKAAPCREQMLDAFVDYKEISSGGRYRNNVGGPVADKTEFQRKCKFVIAFENSCMSGYTTEKIVGAFAAGAIPIYWGNPDIGLEFNTGSFINCHEYGLTQAGEPEIIERIAETVKTLDQDDDLYRKMLEKPAFADGLDIGCRRREFENFLYNIFDQPVDSAYRRNRYYWGRMYERKEKIGNSFYQFLRKGIGIRDAVRKWKT